MRVWTSSHCISTEQHWSRKAGTLNTLDATLGNVATAQELLAGSEVQQLQGPSREHKHEEVGCHIIASGWYGELCGKLGVSTAHVGPRLN